jgi:methyltransferase (TIGR00027 family)
LGRIPWKNVVIDNISDTAFLVAWYRALESDVPDPIVCDPLARALAGERGRRALEAFPAEDRQGWPIAIRTRTYDELILDAVRNGEVDAVLNLGSGLDARPYRLDLPAALSWVEADFPSVIHYKTTILSSLVPNCRLERCPVDLADEKARQMLLERIGREHGRVIVLTEGFLAYLEEQFVADLATELRALPTMCLWAIDLLSPSFLAQQTRAFGGVFRAAGIELQFAPARGLDFFVQYGWQPRRVLSFFDEARRLGRGPVLTPAERTAVRSACSYVLLESVVKNQ